MTEAVSLGELLHEEALFGLTSIRKVGVPRGRLFPSGLCLSAISRVVWAWPDPLPTGLNGDGKKCTDPMVGGARSITLYDACTPSSDFMPQQGMPTSCLKTHPLSLLNCTHFLTRPIQNCLLRAWCVITLTDNNWASEARGVQSRFRVIYICRSVGRYVCRVQKCVGGIT